MQQTEFEMIISTITYVSVDTINRIEARRAFKKLGFLNISERDFHENWIALVKRAKKELTGAFEWKENNGDGYLELTHHGTDSDWCQNILRLPQGYFD